MGEGGRPAPHHRPRNRELGDADHCGCTSPRPTCYLNDAPGLEEGCSVRSLALSASCNRDTGFAGNTFASYWSNRECLLTTYHSAKGGGSSTDHVSLPHAYEESITRTVDLFGIAMKT